VRKGQQSHERGERGDPIVPKRGKSPIGREKPRSPAWLTRMGVTSVSDGQFGGQHFSEPKKRAGSGGLAAGKGGVFEMRKRGLTRSSVAGTKRKFVCKKSPGKGQARSIFIGIGGKYLN